MAGATPRGPLVDDAEGLYRAILYPWQWVASENRPSSSAFDEEVFSVDIKARTTPQKTIDRFREVIRLVEFNSGQARQIGFETRDEIDERFPDNRAHANVYFLGYSDLAARQRKKRARRLAELCLPVETRAS